MQTTILANAVNLGLDPQMRDKYQTEISASGVYIVMDAAVRASEMIPTKMTAAQAANEFCTWMLHNLRDVKIAGGENPQLPNWFARG